MLQKQYKPRRRTCLDEAEKDRLWTAPNTWRAVNMMERAEMKTRLNGMEQSDWFGGRDRVAVGSGAKFLTCRRESFGRTAALGTQ
jgi:hypothetical protein